MDVLARISIDPKQEGSRARTKVDDEDALQAVHLQCMLRADGNVVEYTEALASVRKRVVCAPCKGKHPQSNKLNQY